jgi:hypothetical protein
MFTGGWSHVFSFFNPNENANNEVSMLHPIALYDEISYHIISL